MKEGDNSERNGTDEISYSKGAAAEGESVFSIGMKI